MLLTREDFNENNTIPVREFKFSKITFNSNKIGFFIPCKNAKNQNQIF